MISNSQSYISHLSKDKKFAKIVLGKEVLKLTKRRDVYLYLCFSILSQQLSTKVAPVAPGHRRRGAGLRLPGHRQRRAVPGDKVSINLDKNDGELDITPPDDQHKVDIEVTRLNPDGSFDKFQHEDVDTGGDTAQLHYGDWQGTDKPMTLTVGGTTPETLGDVKGVTDGDGRPSGADNPIDKSPRVLGIGPATVAFGKQDIDDGASASQLAAVTNLGTRAVTLASLAVAGTGAAAFERLTGQTNDCAVGTRLIAGQICVVRLRFDPATIGANSASVTVSSDAPDVSGRPHGDRDKSELSSSAATLALGAHIDDGPTAAQTVTLTNAGTKTISLSAVTLGGAGAASFERLTGQASDCTAATVLSAGAFSLVRARFDPVTTGAKSAAVTITSNAPPATVGLSGSGIQTELTNGTPTLAFGKRRDLRRGDRQPDRVDHEHWDGTGQPDRSDARWGERGGLAGSPGWRTTAAPPRCSPPGRAATCARASIPP